LFIMYEIDLFAEHLRKKGTPDEKINRAIDEIIHFLNAPNSEKEPLDSLKEYCDKHIAGAEVADSTQRIIFLFWYYNYLNDKPASTYLITLLGTLDVIKNQKNRMCQLFGDYLGDDVFKHIAFPALGSDLARYPDSIIAYLGAMQSRLSIEDCQNVLAGNHHDIDTASFKDSKQRFADYPDLPSFLRIKHQELVNKLQKHAETGELWFEQYITHEVVEYVRNHQEIQTGVLDGDRIVVNKIPYNPDAWLKETDPILKRYHACHCPFVRSAILTDQKVPDLWCYCSGGFTKLFFDYLFDKEHKVELLESVLSGGITCRFAIKIT
jgi:hypothetical protein